STSVFLSIMFCLYAHVDCFCFASHAPATTEIYTLSLHDALPIYVAPPLEVVRLPVFQRALQGLVFRQVDVVRDLFAVIDRAHGRSEEHTSELQSRENLVCRLLLEKKKDHNK